MKKIILLRLNPTLALEYNFILKYYDVKIVNSLHDTVLTLLENPDISLLLIEPNKNTETVRKLCEKIHLLNPMMGIYLLKPLELPFQSDYMDENNIRVFPDFHEDDVAAAIKSSMENRRNYNRIKWPLTVKYFKVKNMDHYFQGDVVSLSAGGVYVKADDLTLVQKNLALLLQISFNDFSFFVEGVVVRVLEKQSGEYPRGFSAEFVQVSQPTKAVIHRIVNDKIVTELFAGMFEK